MTVISPMGRVPRRRPVPPRTRRKRRAGPWLAFLVVLILIAVGVWWKVLGTGKGDELSACGPAPSSALAQLQPKTVQVRVYNSTSRGGLAKSVSDGLKTRGYKVVATGNDPLERTVEGVAEIRYGQQGAQQALLLSFLFPGAELLPDPRTDAAVDLAVGAKFTTMATDVTARKAKATAVERAQKGATPSC